LEKRNYSSNNGARVNGYRYVFDDFEVDPANRLCRRGGQPLHLTARVFDILVVFAENPGRLLKKDELIEKVWSAEFVEEANLARNISTLRRALDDDLKDRKYIVTVPGHGYRFIAQVSKLRAPAEEVARETADISPVANATRPALSPLSVTRKLNLRVAALIVTLGLLIAAGSSFWWRAKLSGTKGSKSLVSIENIRPKRLTSERHLAGHSPASAQPAIGNGAILGRLVFRRQQLHLLYDG
jgi:DNA-binding winged helix-turn-helix (wHTH) protein